MSIRQVVSPEIAEPPPGLFSNCLVAGGFIHVSGQHAGTPNGPVGGDSMRAQAAEALRRCLALITAAGGSAKDVVKLTVYVTDIARRLEVSEARREFFTAPLPCSTLVEVKGLVSPDLLVEIEALAVAP